MLSCLGRQGTRAVAALVVIGIALPSIGAVLKPFVTEAVFLLLCIAVLRVDASALMNYVGCPKIVLLATAWTSLVIPTLRGMGYLAFGLKDHSPDLFPRPRSTSNCIAPHGGTRTSCVGGAGCHACAMHHGGEHCVVTPYSALVRLCFGRACAGVSARPF